MARANIEEQVLSICELVNKNEYGAAAIALQSAHTENILHSSDLTTSLIVIEQTACQLLKNCFNNIDTIKQECLTYIEEVGVFNRYIATINTDNDAQIRIQSQVLLDADILKNLVVIINMLASNNSFHGQNFVLSICTWLEAIAHFIHRHDDLFREIIQPLRQSILACVLSDWYQIYIRQSPAKNSPQRAFFIRTCSFVTGVFQCNLLSFENALKTAQSYQIVIPIGKQIIERHLDDFRQYLLRQSNDIENDYECLTGICLLMTNCYNYEAFVKDDDYFNILLRLLKSDFVRNGLLPTWTNDSTILADTLMVQLKNASNDSTIRLFLQQNQAANVVYHYFHADYDRLRLQACMLLGVLLDDATIRQLKIPGDELTCLYFDAIRQAHKLSNKCYKRVPIHMLLRAFAALAHNETIQSSVDTGADYFDFLLTLSDDYNIVYDILWTLSFNNSLHEKFNSHEPFLAHIRKFVDDPKSVLDKDVVRSAEGILWNLLDQNRIIPLPHTPVNADEKNVPSRDRKQKISPIVNYPFDIMISYCHAEKSISKSIFEYLNSKGYRVWYDAKNMHGDSLQAMANAIQDSQCILICMSENYELSNACRHEAQYAYVLQRRIVPIVAQSKYKARNWLGFVIGTLIYIDFTKYELNNAFSMLEAEMEQADKTNEVKEKKIPVNQSEKKQAPKISLSREYEHKCVKEWTHDDVISWCHAYDLLVISKLLEHYGGTHLLRLHNVSKVNGDNIVFQSLQDDCQKIGTNDKVSLSFTEFVRFQSELETRIERDTVKPTTITAAEKKTTKSCSLL
ncbi:unnamed protein product [Rotaria socialis]